MPSTRSLLPEAGGHSPDRDGCPPRTFELDVTLRSSRPLSRSELGASEITHRSELSRRHQAPPASFCSTARLTSTPRESTAPDIPLGSRAARSAPKSVTRPADASPSREPSPDGTQASSSGSTAPWGDHRASFVTCRVHSKWDSERPSSGRGLVLPRTVRRIAPPLPPVVLPHPRVRLAEAGCLPPLPSCVTVTRLARPVASCLWHRGAWGLPLQHSSSGSALRPTHPR